MATQSPPLEGGGSQYTGWVSGLAGAGTYTIPISHNGATPVILGIEYQLGEDGFTSGTPSWIATPSVNANNQLIITFNSGISSSYREIRFLLAHGENNAAYHLIHIIQTSVF